MVNSNCCVESPQGQTLHPHEGRPANDGTTTVARFAPAGANGRFTEPQGQALQPHVVVVVVVTNTGRGQGQMLQPQELWIGAGHGHELQPQSWLGTIACEVTDTAGRNVATDGRDMATGAGRTGVTQGQTVQPHTASFLKFPAKTCSSDSRFATNRGSSPKPQGHCTQPHSATDRMRARVTRGEIATTWERRTHARVTQADGAAGAWRWRMCLWWR